MDQAESHHGHDGRRNAYAQKNGRDGLFQPHVQHCCHQGPRPGAGARQGDGHQNAKANGAVLAHHPPLEMGLFLQPGDFLIPPRAALPQPAEYVPDIDNDKGHRHHIAQHRRRQGQRVIQSQGDSVRQAAPQFDDGDHGNKKCGNDLAQCRRGNPSDHTGLSALIA